MSCRGEPLCREAVCISTLDADEVETNEWRGASPSTSSLRSRRIKDLTVEEFRSVLLNSTGQLEDSLSQRLDDRFNRLEGIFVDLSKFCGLHQEQSSGQSLQQQKHTPSSSKKEGEHQDEQVSALSQGTRSQNEKKRIESVEGEPQPKDYPVPKHVRITQSESLSMSAEDLNEAAQDIASGSEHHGKTVKMRACFADNTHIAESAGKRGTFHFHKTEHALEEDEKEDHKTKKCSFVIHPTSRFASCFQSVGVVVLFYDIVTIPYLVAWEPPTTDFLYVAAFVTLIFWLADMVLNFFIGFYDKGQLEMRHSIIIRNNLKTWFPFDVFINGSALLTLLLEDVGAGKSMELVRIGKFARIGRVLRLLQLLRLSRLQKRLDKFNFMSPEQTNFKGVLGLCIRIVIFLFFLNHFISCAWYGIGRIEAGSTFRSWLDIDGKFGDGSTYRDAGDLFQYLTALHWAMSQLTPGNIEIYPQNSAERIFNIVILMNGLLVGALIISQLAAKMTMTRTANLAKEQQKEKLTRFLKERNINRKLMMNIQKEIDERMRLQSQKNLVEKDVTTLALLSNKTRRELHFDAFSSHLLKHPLFRAWYAIEPSLITALCTNAAEIVSLSEGDEVFNPLTSTAYMYYVLSGSLRYTFLVESKQAFSSPHKIGKRHAFTGINTECMSVWEGTWVSEIALWTTQPYTGTLEAVTQTTLVSIKISEVIALLEKCSTLLEINSHYSFAFCAHCTAALGSSCIDVDIDHATIINSMPIPGRILMMQPLIDLVCLQTSNHARHQKDVRELQEEVNQGKCILTMARDGSVHRTLLVAVLRLTKNELTLCRIASLKNEKLVGRCQLPGTKIQKGEQPLQSVRRLIATEIDAKYNEDLSFGQVEVNVETKPSQSFGVSTKYIRNIVPATFKSPLEECPDERPREPRFRFSAVSGGGISEQTKLIPTKVWQSDDGSHTYIHAWLSQQEFDFFSTRKGEESLDAWLAESKDFLLSNASSREQYRRSIAVPMTSSTLWDSTASTNTETGQTAL